MTPPKRSLRAIGAALVLAAWPVLAAVAAGGSGPNETRLDAQLAAGEFAAALETVRHSANPMARDAGLARVAAAQAAVGSRSSSLGTAAEIGDDRTRAEALSAIAAQPIGGQGGASLADFDSLIDLITSTVQPTTWDEVGGPGSIEPFPTGVYVDPDGLLRRAVKTETGGQLAALRAAAAPAGGPRDVRRASSLRMVSLPRLEKQVQLRLAAGRTLDDEMLLLAGLERIQYVFVYPDSGDLVLAGPAGNWAVDAENRVVSAATGQPVVRLDALVVILRHMMSGRGARFGCAITPTQGALARTQAYVKDTTARPLAPGQRKEWLEGLRSQLGRQKIDVYGLDPRTRASRLMVEADYRMKLVGMGLEEGVPGVESFLDLIKVPAGDAAPPMAVLRWWFTLNYDAVLAARDRQAFALRGQGVKVLSENEMLTEQGERVHTGQSDELNSRFARQFTTHFAELCQKYPVYAELRNLFDLALAFSLCREEDLPGKAGWHMTCFGSQGNYPIEFSIGPDAVETVVNHRVINRVHIVAGASGGVRVDPTPLVTAGAMETESDGAIAGRRAAAAARSLPADAWWWDAGE